MVNIYEGYVRDLGFLIRDMAMESKQAADDNKTGFSTGYMAGFHRVVSLMQQQAEGFGIPLDKIGLDGIDPDEDLV